MLWIYSNRKYLVIKSRSNLRTNTLNFVYTFILWKAGQAAGSSAGSATSGSEADASGDGGIEAEA